MGGGGVGGDPAGYLPSPLPCPPRSRKSTLVWYIHSRYHLSRALRLDCAGAAAVEVHLVYPVPCVAAGSGTVRVSTPPPSTRSPTGWHGCVHADCPAPALPCRFILLTSLPLHNAYFTSPAAVHTSLPLLLCAKLLHCPCRYAYFTSAAVLTSLHLLRSF